MIHMTNERNEDGKLCVHMTHIKIYANGMTCQYTYVIYI